MSADSSPSEAASHARARRIVHYVSLTSVILCPALMLLPPRKLDIYTFALVTCMGVGANQLYRDQNGISIAQRIAGRASTRRVEGPITAATVLDRDLPSDRAREVQRRLRAEKLAREGQGLGNDGQLLAAVAAKEKESRNAVQQIWMGDEKADWKAERLREEQKALDEGKGYGDLIMQQIREVWKWGEKKSEEVKQKDVEIVKRQK